MNLRAGSEILFALGRRYPRLPLAFLRALPLPLLHALRAPGLRETFTVAAGAPWFMTLFGRDSLLTSWMAMMVDPDLALGTLQTLARFQGRAVNPLTEEEPGRILHEMLFGEAAGISLGGGTIYYGSADATPLFVMVLGELQRWGSRRGDVDALLPAADRALEWITAYGDKDGDGYVEYERASDRGLVNQGWKDSWDAVRFADGRLARPPIAMCEVQGYVYAALVARSHFATEGGDGKAKMQQAEKELSVIAGQKPVRTKAKKSVANFKVREGMETGLKVTLRGQRMYEFLDRMITLAIPRVKDFRGLDPNGFDKAGNYNFGFTEQTVFPEVNAAEVTFQQGMNITMVTTAKNPEQGRELLRHFGMPFREHTKQDR